MLILEWWKQLGQSRQDWDRSGAVVILLLMGGLSYFVFSEKYMPLLGDRELTDQGSVVTALDGSCAIPDRSSERQGGCSRVRL